MQGLGQEGYKRWQEWKSEEGVFSLHNLLRYGNIISHFSYSRYRNAPSGIQQMVRMAVGILPFAKTNKHSMNKIMKFFPIFFLLCVCFMAAVHRKENFVLCNPHVEIIKPHCIILK